MVNQADIVVKLAQAEVGNNKGGQKFWGWYGFESRVSWCACFYSWLMEQAGLECVDLRKNPYNYCQLDGQALISKGCVQILAWYEAHNRRIGEELAKPGDVILYEWNPEDGDNGDGVDHVGIIEYVEGDSVENQILHTIEGNWSDNVSRRTVKYRDANVWAICRPKYYYVEEEKLNDKLAIMQQAFGIKLSGVYDTDTQRAFNGSVIEYGDRGAKVQALQYLLNTKGADIEADGIFGKGTKEAVIGFQKEKGLLADGIAGVKTITALCDIA